MKYLYILIFFNFILIVGDLLGYERKYTHGKFDCNAKSISMINGHEYFLFCEFQKKEDSAFYDSLLIKATKNGSVKWKTVFSKLQITTLHKILPSTNKGYLIIGVTENSYKMFAKRHIFYCKISQSGKKRLEKKIQKGRLVSVHKIKNNLFIYYAVDNSPSGVDFFLCKLNNLYSVVWRKKIKDILVSSSNNNNELLYFGFHFDAKSQKYAGKKLVFGQNGKKIKRIIYSKITEYTDNIYVDHDGNLIFPTLSKKKFTFNQIDEDQKVIWETSVNRSRNEQQKKVFLEKNEVCVITWLKKNLSRIIILEKNSGKKIFDKTYRANVEHFVTSGKFIFLCGNKQGKLGKRTIWYARKKIDNK